MSHEKAFLGNVRKALADVLPRQNKAILLSQPPDDRWEILAKMKDKSPERRAALMSILKKNAAPIHLNVVPVKNQEAARKSILALIQDKTPEYGTRKSVAAWSHPLVDGLDLEPALSQMDIPLVRPPKEATPSPAARETLRQGVIASFVGITSADYCIADTATLTMKSAFGCPRSMSLVPLIHVAVIRLDQVLEDLKELYFRLQWDPEEQRRGLTNYMTFISGPSKTGDIELVMVHGAHGPREVHLYVITEDGP